MKSQKKKINIQPSTEITPMADPPQPPSENMEVHHHGHVHHKTKWKEYIFQFFMLFLAVFCGFLAEYQLEHKIEDDREKQFIKSFIEDLKIDTTAINNNLLYRETKEKRMDSLILLLRNQKIKGNENELYFLGRTLIRNNRFLSNDGTISQLKYSGSLRLIKNKNAADSMMSYQKTVELIQALQEEDRIERVATLPILAKIFDPFVFNDMLDEDNGINRPIGNPPLLSYESSLQKDLAHSINLLKGTSLQMKARLRTLNEKAKNTIAFLNSVYHLK